MDTLFFIAAKVFWALVRPSTWIVLGLALGVLMLWRGRLRGARIATGLTLLFTLAVAILPLGDFLLRPLESRYPPAPELARVDGIIVLGGAEDPAVAGFWGGHQFNDAAERYTEAIALARRFPAARLVFTGGSGRLRDLGGIETPESAIAESFFLGHGLAPGRFRQESASRNTAENAVLSLPVAAPAPGETWVLVTSAFHMPRAMQSFARAGWPDLTPWPVDHRTRAFGAGLGWDLPGNLDRLETALKEYVGLIAYSLTGR